MAEPQLVLLFSGKRKSGKDFICEKLKTSHEHERARDLDELHIKILNTADIPVEIKVVLLSTRIGEENCCIVRISEPIKRLFAKKYDLSLEELMSDGPYKEKYRIDMINWSDDIRKSDAGFFCRAACKTAPLRKIWLISDIRRKTDLKWFRENYSNVRTIRISADLTVREARGWIFTKGVDDVESECDLDDVGSWDFLMTNNDDQDSANIIETILRIIHS